MKKLILIPLFLLAGCGSMFKQPVPVSQKFPEAVPELMKKCEELMSIEGDKIPITELFKVIVHNYSLYYQCSNKVDGWQEWYLEQKKIYESIKK